MEALNNNWLTDGLMDVEFKKYVLLAYLKSCSDNFKENKLYPQLSDLVRHYHNLNELGNNMESLQKAFPKELSGFDFNKLKLEFDNLQPTDEYISTITEIMQFAIPNIQYTIEEGKGIYEEIEKHIEIGPVGIIPVYNQEGYLLLHQEYHKDVFVYQYHHSVVTHANENLRALSLNYLCKEVKSIANPIEQIKLNLIKKFKELPHPATFLCLSRIQLPMTETLLPLAKRLMITKALA